MRTIKFRAWDGKRMTTSGIMFNSTTGCLVVPDGSQMKLMQFTGLHDKNGVPIFEGDILRELYYPLGVNKKAVQYYKDGVVCFKNLSFGLILKFSGLKVLNKSLAESHHKERREVHIHSTAGTDWFSKIYENTLYEIIGNIHQTPELL